jgi:ParB family chromosome partitioning protein
MAFAVSDDYAAQERVFDNLSDWNREPENIRDALTEHETAATDRRVRFVTLAVYERAGGGVRRDLFCEDDSGIFILDTVLLDRLVGEKLEAEAASVRAEGWKWVTTCPAFDYDEWSGYRRRQEESVPLSPEAEAELELLSVEHDRLCDENAEPDDETQARLDEIEQRIDEIQTGETFWPPETLAWPARLSPSTTTARSRSGAVSSAPRMRPPPQPTRQTTGMLPAAILPTPKMRSSRLDCCLKA